MKTCMESSNNFSYMMLNLVGEVGEFASKVAKLIRKEEAYTTYSDLFIDSMNTEAELEKYSGEYCEKLTEERNAKYIQELQKEAGDILWQLAGLCSVMGWDLDDIAQQNLDKLADRQRRDKIDGDGDNR